MAPGITRKDGESLHKGDNSKVTVLTQDNKPVKLAIEAPRGFDD
jgi:sRNA-binding carbon storage regulator CsrA